MANWATAAGAALVVFFAGLIIGAHYQEEKDLCEISQQLNFLGLNARNVAKYCDWW